MTRSFKILVPLLTILFFFGFFEFVLSFSFKHNNEYYVWMPNIKFESKIDSINLRKVSDNARSSYNSIGARSNEIPDTPTQKIVVFGGSTTESAAIDQNKIWTSLLQNNLNKNNDSIPFWVGNFGMHGNDTHNHIVQSEIMLDYNYLKDAKAVIYLAGVNDLTRSLEEPKRYGNYSNEKTLKEAFMIFPDNKLPMHRRFAIFKFLKKLNFKIRHKKNTKEHINNAYKELRERRAKSKKTTNLPNLNTQLKYYRKNIEKIINICRSKNIKPILLTQPVLWRENISAESEKIIYTNFSKRENLETATLAKCMQLFNNVMIDVCQEMNADYIDLSSLSKENWFYDDCHFNETGSLEISKIIALNLKSILHK